MADEEDTRTLHELIVAREYSKSRQMIVKGADINAPDERGWTVTQLAIRTGEQNIVRLVIGTEEARNAKINEIDRAGYTPLHQAVEMRNPIIVNLLLMDGGVDVDAVNSMGLTPLQAAVAIGGETIVDMLIEAKARTDVVDLRGFSLMYRAAYENRPEVIQSLIDANVDPDVPNPQGETALQHAVSHEYDEVAEKLRAYIEKRQKVSVVAPKEKEKGV